MNMHVIQLEKHDDIVSVRDRLSLLQADRVLLVLPYGGGILRRKLDLVLVQRAAAQMNTQLGLVTNDFDVIENADDLRIPVFYSVCDSRHTAWVSSPLDVFTRRDDRPKNAPEAAEVIAQNQKVELLIPPEFMAVRRVLSWLVFAVVVAVLIFGLYVVAPGARITLRPAADQVTVTIPIVADPELEALNLVDHAIPARIIGVEVQWSTTIPTTGRVETPNTKAAGAVLFRHALASTQAEAVTVPAGTVVSTTADEQVLRFQTTEAVTVPAGVDATAEAPIEAIDPGPSGNVRANLINRLEGPLSVQLVVINPEPTRGGGLAEVQAVAKEDLERLRSTLLQQLQQRAYAEMLVSKWVGEDDFVSTESLAVVLVLQEDASADVGQPAENVSLDMRVVVQGVVINAQYARQVAYGALAAQVGEGHRILDNTLVFMPGEELSVDDARRVTFLMTCTGDTARDINPKHVRDMVAGIPLNEAAERLHEAYPLEDEPDFELWPALFGRMPLLPIRVEVDIHYSG